MIGGIRLVYFLSLLRLCVLFPAEDEQHNIPDYPESTKLFRFNEKEDETSYWLNNGLDAISNRLNTKINKGLAKNVIMFLGDGMSVPTLAASRIFLGQLNGSPGEESFLSFEKFPYVGLSKTYCVDSQVADSACTSTAYLNGVKANIKTIGVTASVKLRDCDAMNVEEYQTESIASWAQKAGKATGLVTTTRVTHASPAGLFAHIAHRDWEYDGIIAEHGKDPKKCMDITKQLVTQSPGNNLKVVMGGGRSTFFTLNHTDPEYPNKKGLRQDGVCMVKSWLEDKKQRLNVNASFVWNREAMFKAKNSDYLLGLFEPSHMKYHLDANETSEPTLEEMTEVAINILKKENNGFFLFVEGGKIDMAHHDSYAKIALDETVEFSKAIQKARDLTSEEDTLIVVTADHAHTMSFSGYPERGSDILSKLQKSNIDSKPYTTLSYANGPGYKQNDTVLAPRHNLTNDNFGDIWYRYPATVPLGSETHGGDDVAVFASGPWSHLLIGNYEQNVIPLVMGYAARIGPSANIAFPNSGINLTSLPVYSLILVALILRKVL